MTAMITNFRLHVSRSAPQKFTVLFGNFTPTAGCTVALSDTNPCQSANWTVNGASVSNGVLNFSASAAPVVVVEVPGPGPGPGPAPMAAPLSDMMPPDPEPAPVTPTGGSGTLTITVTNTGNPPTAVTGVAPVLAYD